MLRSLSSDHGVLYHPEKKTTTLFLVFQADTAVLKDIVRQWKEHSVEIEITELSIEQPLTWGFYEGNAWLHADYDCEKIRGSMGDDNLTGWMGKDQDDGATELFCNGVWRRG